jgi:CRISPR/Cas system-associated protein Cas10 (large subunit of type III CRISPR-Cas system)
MNFDEKEFHAVVLGALLHDIGKFVQQALFIPKYLKDDFEVFSFESSILNFESLILNLEF